MLMRFGWGEDPTPEQMPYRVDALTLSSSAADTLSVGNVEPQTLIMTISVAPENSGALVEMWRHGRNQHDNVSEDGTGKIAVYRGEGVGESVLELRFEGSWIAELDATLSSADDRMTMTVMVNVSVLEMSGGGADVRLANHRRMSLISQ
jgi:hypothetical protein